MINQTTQDALSALLKALGFGQMSKDVCTEQNHETLGRYARIIIKNSPQEKRAELVSHFRHLRLVS